jgi:type IV pilus assembly protein PilE
MMRSRNTVKGFTLIELMVVVAIVAILAAIALPSYNDSVRKSRRGQVKADIAELAQRAERWHTINNTYEGFWATVPAGEQVSPRTGGTAAYNITMAEAPNTFTFTATPQGGQTQDVRCMTLTLNQAGAKTKSGTGTLADCW